jgi:ribosomal protein S18
MASIETEWN